MHKEETSAIPKASKATPRVDSTGPSNFPESQLYFMSLTGMSYP